jgi:thiamine biosynthesis protein ThiS
VTISQLLSRLDIDARRVAVELNLQVVKRAAFETSTITEGDEVEVVNFVGGG